MTGEGLGDVRPIELPVGRRGDVEVTERETGWSGQVVGSSHSTLVGLIIRTATVGPAGQTASAALALAG